MKTFFTLLLIILHVMSMSAREFTRTDTSRDTIGAAHLEEAEKARAEYLREVRMKNRPGTVAPDFRFETITGESSSLHDIKSDGDILLIFYDHDCKHCTDAIETISGNEPTSVSIIAAIDISYDKDFWKEYAQSLPSHWITGYATDPILDEETYVIEDTPTIFLIDKHKKILLKNATLQQLYSH